MNFTNLALTKLFLASFNDQFKAFKPTLMVFSRLKLGDLHKWIPLFVCLKWHFSECLINTLCHINNSLKSLWDNNRLRILEDRAQSDLKYSYGEFIRIGKIPTS